MFVILIPESKGQIGEDQGVYIFRDPEIPPIPKHLSSQATQKFILDKIQYPKGFQKEGLVVVRFMVDIDGTVLSPKIMKGIDPRVDKQILDIIEDIEFIPGKFFEKEIPMYVNLPLRISLLN